MTTTDWPKPGMQSTDIDLLHAVLKSWCADSAIGMKSERAKLVARSLVDWFEFGIKDPAELRALIDEDQPRL